MQQFMCLIVYLKGTNFNGASAVDETEFIAVSLELNRNDFVGVIPKGKLPNQRHEWFIEIDTESLP